ncbi:MAG: GDSL-type esterase/lipase family protein [Evtepia sp.]
MSISFSKLLAFSLSVTLLLSLFGCGKQTPSAVAPPSEPPSVADETTDTTDTTDTATPPTPPSPTPVTATTPESSPLPDVHPVNLSIPESAAVSDDYFADAIFIGNSRTEGFVLYSGLSNVRALDAIGLTVKTAFSKPLITMDGQKLTVMDALAKQSFSKVYIMLGMNELGWVYGSVFQEDYGKIIDRIREINPNATIFIQSILPVSKEKSASHPTDNNPRIAEYNNLLRDLANEKNVYFLNVAEAIADENGDLPADASTDGMHLIPDYCKKWLAYLKTHTI